MHAFLGSYVELLAMSISYLDENTLLCYCGFVEDCIFIWTKMCNNNDCASV